MELEHGGERGRESQIIQRVASNLLHEKTHVKHLFDDRLVALIDEMSEDVAHLLESLP